MLTEQREPGSFLIMPGRWKLTWICTFCFASHVWELGIPDDNDIRDVRLRVAQAVANHLHCSPGCGRYVSGGAVLWAWQADD